MAFATRTPTSRALWNRRESDVSYVELGQPAELYHDPGLLSSYPLLYTVCTILLYFSLPMHTNPKAHLHLYSLALCFSLSPIFVKTIESFSMISKFEKGLKEKEMVFEKTQGTGIPVIVPTSTHIVPFN
ncbi:hypothetical protein V1477_018696 [Vespula maculifrons]|uniref:Uncharacterized protein n=1 Tax=Vespula maculifrons TaxID=7453 RepID=A0ABD2AYP0_VESMC